MKTILAFLGVSLLSTACNNESSRIVELNDKLIELENATYEVYYSTTEVEEAEKVLVELIEKALEYKDRGAKSEPILWAAYFRLADIHHISGKREEAEECIRKSISNLEKLEQIFRPKESLSLDYTKDRLSHIDENVGRPKWKSDSTESLIQVL